MILKGDKRTLHSLFIRAASGVGVGVILFGSLFLLPAWVFSLLLLLSMFYILFIEWPQLIVTPRWWFLTPLYPVAPFLIMIFFNERPALHRFLQLLFVITVSNDIGAYYVGTFLGKHYLLPSISPQKTWEGFFGGCCFVIGVLWFVHGRLVSLSLPMIIFSGITMAFVATAGDLFESWLKRKAGVKDSGSLIPGHGGLLDRLDSALFLSIFFALILMFGIIIAVCKR